MPINRPAAVALDARSLQPATKTEQILDAFDKLQIGSALEIGEETDPRALRNEMAQLRPGRFSWDARNLGSNRWTIRLERIDEHADGETFLTHVAAFTSAKGGTIKELASQLSDRSYRAGDTIFDEGEVWPYLGIVKSGKIIYTLLSPDGKTHTIGERLTHDTLNESGTFDGGGATTRAEALTDATIVTLPSEAVIHAARSDAELALGFLIASSQARRRSIDTIADLAFAHVLQRVAKFLTRLRPHVGWNGSRPSGSGESFAGADRSCGRHRARHGGAGPAPAQERLRSRARPRPSAGDRPRSAGGLCPQRAGSAGVSLFTR